MKPYSTISNSKQLPHFVLYLLSFVKLGFDLWNLDLHKRWNKGICFMKCFKFCHWSSSKHSVWEVDIFQDLLKDSFSRIMFHILFFSSFFFVFSMENYARTKSWLTYVFWVPWNALINIPKEIDTRNLSLDITLKLVHVFHLIIHSPQSSQTPQHPNIGTNRK